MNWIVVAVIIILSIAMLGLTIALVRKPKTNCLECPKDLATDLAQALANAGLLQHKLTNAEKNLAQNDIHIKALEKTIAEMIDGVSSSCPKELQDAREEIEEYKNTMTEAAQTLADYENALTVAKTDIDVAKQKIQANAITITRLENELDSAHYETLLANQKIKGLRQELDQAANKIEDLHDEYDRIALHYHVHCPASYNNFTHHT
jgi:chromosome segregation ATPase